MKKQILFNTAILVLFNLFFNSAFSQNFKWVNHQSINFQFNPDIISVLCETDSYGNSLLASMNSFKVSFGGFYGDVSLKKYNPAGAMMFNKILHGKILAEGIQTDPGGNIYLTGSFMDTLKIDQVNFILNTGSGFEVNYFMIKLAPNGDLVWKKNINMDYNTSIRIEAVRVKGNHLFAGLINAFDGYIKKFDLEGNEIMSITQTNIRNISGIDIDRDGNINAAGACGNGNVNFGGHTVNSPFTYNVYFVKYNPSGIYQWSRFVEDVTFSSIDIVCDNSGNLYASGNLSGSFMFGNIQVQGSQWVYDFFLTKLDAAGNFLWVKEVPNTPTITGDAAKGKVNAIGVDQHNNVYLAGFLRSTVNWGNNVITISSGYSDALILKYDQNGNVLMGKRAGGTVGGDRIDDISVDNSGNVFVSGNFAATAIFDTITATGSGNVNLFLAKIQVSGNIDVKLIVEGFYNLSSDDMRIRDTAKIYLRNSSSPFSIIDSSKTTIDPQTFTGSFTVSNAATGTYYIQTVHRNSLETWSSVPVSYIQSGNVEYDFIASASGAYGKNVRQVNSSPFRFAIYSGDVDQDGNIDLADIVLVNNDVADFVTGYVNSDVNGDNLTDLSDIIFTFNNSNNFVSLIRP